jgi:hypothetical protein
VSTSRTDKTQQDLDAALAKIAGRPEPYAQIGARLHEAITTAVPGVGVRLRDRRGRHARVGARDRPSRVRPAAPHGQCWWYWWTKA